MNKEQLETSIRATELAIANCILRIASAKSQLDCALKREREFKEELEKLKSERRKLDK